MTETPWLSIVRDTLCRAGWKVTRVNSGGRVRGIRLAEAGTPDLICCAPGGIYVAVETKAGGYTMSDAQYAFRDDVVRLGGQYVLLPDGVPELLQQLLREFR